MLKTVPFVQIGTVLKSNGTDGQVLISLKAIGTEDISENEPVFIYFDGLPVPFFMSDISVRSATRALVHLTDVNSLKDADELTGKALYYPEDYFEDEDFQDFTGWTLRDGKTEIGTVEGIEDIPGNPCLEIKTTAGGNVLIPLHEDLVTLIDEKNKIIEMALPDGLLDV